MFFIFGVKIKRIIINISRIFKLVKFGNIFVCKEKSLKNLKNNIEVSKGERYKIIMP